MRPAVSSSGTDPHEENDEIDDEEQDDGGFQDEHPTIVLIVLQDLVEITERLQLLFHGLMPIAQVKARGEVLIEPGEMPVSKKLRDVQQLIAKSRHIDPNFPKFQQN